jgi:hypothetical protein
MKTEKQLPEGYTLDKEAVNMWTIKRDGYYNASARIFGEGVEVLTQSKFLASDTLLVVSHLVEHLKEHGNLDAYTKPVSKWRVTRTGHYERVYRRGTAGWVAERDRSNLSLSYTGNLPMDELTELHQRFLDRGTFLEEGEEYADGV